MNKHTEVAELKSDLGLKSYMLNRLFNEVMQSVGGFGGYNDQDGLTIQVNLNSLLRIDGTPTIASRESADYPFEVSTKLGGVKYIAVIDREEWLEWAASNNICTECGTDKEWLQVGEEQEFLCPGKCDW